MPINPFAGGAVSNIAGKGKKPGGGPQTSPGGRIVSAARGLLNKGGGPAAPKMQQGNKPPAGARGGTRPAIPKRGPKMPVL